MEYEAAAPVQTNRPQMYKRSASSAWVAIPRTTDRALAFFMRCGTWFAIRTELGDVITNQR